MVSDMVRPAVVTFLDMMLRDKEQVLRVEEVAVGEGSALAGKTIEEAKLEEKTGALLVALKKAETKGYEFNPPKGRKIQENDILIFIGSPEKLSALRI
jgi:voltage-gated potassium channel